MTNKKHFLKYSLPTLFFVSLLFWGSVSCSNNDIALDNRLEEAESELVGLWADTTDIEPYGFNVSTLLFSMGNNFVAKEAKFGIYPETNEDMVLSSFDEYQGNYIQSLRNIYFATQQKISWDLQLSTSPNFNTTNQSIFEDCSYTIANDTLTLTYTEQQGKESIRNTKKYKRK